MAINVNIGGGVVSVYRDWPDFRKLLDGTEKDLRVQYEQDAEKYFLFAVDSTIFYFTEIFKLGFEPMSWDAQRIADNTTYRTEFLSDYVTAANKRNPMVTTENKNITKRIELGTTYDYIGTAPLGTLDTDVAWTIKRITKNVNGDPEKIEWTADSSTAWTDRVNATYS